MRRRAKYTEGEIGRLRVIGDFLPPLAYRLSSMLSNGAAAWLPLIPAK